MKLYDLVSDHHKKLTEIESMFKSDFKTIQEDLKRIKGISKNSLEDDFKKNEDK